MEDIPELLNLLEAAKKNVPCDTVALANHEFDFPMHLMELDLAEEKPLGERLGVPRSVFPVVEHLEEDEVALVVAKILELWRVFNYFADFPDHLPPRIAYEALLSVWDEPVMFLSTGQWHFDWCNQDLDTHVPESFKQPGKQPPLPPDWLDEEKKQG